LLSVPSGMMREVMQRERTVDEVSKLFIDESRSIHRF
jgi:hypothetical protein